MLQDVLTEVIEDLYHFFPQFPQSFQCEGNKEGHPKKAIIVKPWASATIIYLPKIGSPFVTFTTDVVNGLQHCLDENSSVGTHLRYNRDQKNGRSPP